MLHEMQSKVLHLLNEYASFIMFHYEYACYLSYNLSISIPMVLKLR